jgi:hypothetical protein
MYLVEIHEDDEVSICMDKQDLALAIEALKKMVKIQQNPEAGLHADAMELLLGFEDILKEVEEPQS